MVSVEEFVGYELDKFGKIWGIIKSVDLGMTKWWAGSKTTEGIRGEGKASVKTHDVVGDLFDEDLRLRPMAYLNDITAHPQDRGVGSFLLRAIIEDCKQCGHKGIEGHLSESDHDHFDKLAYWYPSNGFQIRFYDDKEKRRTRWLGCVCMVFDEKDAQEKESSVN